jgi:hypothetical protein
MGSRAIRSHTRAMSAVTLINAGPAASSRLLLDVKELHGRNSADREPALDRLEAALGRDLADRLVAALSKQDRHRLEAALSPEFADHVTAVLAKGRGAFAPSASPIVELRNLELSLTPMAQPYHRTTSKEEENSDDDEHPRVSTGRWFVVERA